MSVDLRITGTGSLAQATLFDLMTITVAPLKIMLAGRHQAPPPEFFMWAASGRILQGAR